MLEDQIEAAVGRRPTKLRALSGGCVGEVYVAHFADGERTVVKVDDRPQPKLDIEATMLRYLADHSTLPVPAVFFSSSRLLLMEFVEGESRFSPAAEAHAADLLASLHAISAPKFGFEHDTLIGGLHQPNPLASGWIDFFREQRLLEMGRQGLESGRLPATLFGRLESFCAKLDAWLIEPAQPSLIHGDVWTTNVLAQSGRITAFLDPAIYYAHPEIELAFITLFSTFGPDFFDRYQSIRPLEPGFFETRRDIYNLYPLLVHVRLFGGSYVQSVGRILQRFGC